MDRRQGGTEVLQEKESTGGSGATGEPIEYLDFGCGTGASLQFASSLIAGRGVGLDRSGSAINTVRAKGFEAECVDILDFDKKNAASACFAINVLQELNGRREFERACVNIVQAARNFAIFQHQYFDDDPQLARDGLYVEANFSNPVLYTPTVSDYAVLANRYATALNIAGIAIFGFGRAETRQLFPDEMDFGQQRVVPSPYKSIRIVLGRKEIGRFRRALEKFGTGTSIFLWERS